MFLFSVCFMKFNVYIFVATSVFLFDEIWLHMIGTLFLFYICFKNRKIQIINVDKGFFIKFCSHFRHSFWFSNFKSFKWHVQIINVFYHIRPSNLNSFTSEQALIFKTGLRPLFLQNICFVNWNNIYTFRILFEHQLKHWKNKLMLLELFFS